MSSNRNLQSFATTLQKKLTVPLRINKWDELKDFDKEQRINSLSRQLFVALYRKSTYLLRHHVWVLNLPLAAQWGGTPSSSTVQLRHHRKPCEPSIEESSKACSADRTRNKDTLGGHGAAKHFFQSAGYKPYFRWYRWWRWTMKLRFVDGACLNQGATLGSNRSLEMGKKNKWNPAWSFHCTSLYKKKWLTLVLS